MRRIFTLLFVLISPLMFGQDLQEVLDQYNDHSIPYISAPEMVSLSPEVWILDARESEEFEVSHIPNAHYIGFKDFSEETVIDLITDTNATIVVYCSVGVRSEKIAKRLQKMGFQNVKNLYGGIFEWANNDYPLESAEGASTNKIHAYSKQWGRFLLKGEKVY